MEINNQESFEVLELVLKNLAEEQQKTCKMLAEQAVILDLLCDKLVAYMKQVQQIKLYPPQVNLKTIEELIHNYMEARGREGNEAAPEGCPATANIVIFAA